MARSLYSLWIASELGFHYYLKVRQMILPDLDGFSYGIYIFRYEN